MPSKRSAASVRPQGWGGSGVADEHCTEGERNDHGTSQVNTERSSRSARAMLGFPCPAQSTDDAAGAPRERPWVCRRCQRSRCTRRTGRLVRHHGSDLGECPCQGRCASSWTSCPDLRFPGSSRGDVHWLCTRLSGPAVAGPSAYDAAMREPGGTVSCGRAIHGPRLGSARHAGPDSWRGATAGEPPTTRSCSGIRPSVSPVGPEFDPRRQPFRLPPGAPPPSWASILLPVLDPDRTGSPGGWLPLCRTGGAEPGPPLD